MGRGRNGATLEGMEEWNAATEEGKEEVKDR